MSTGILATACLCLALGDNPNDVYYTNKRNQSVPVQIQTNRENIKAIRLYASTDQGHQWNLVQEIGNNKNAFTYLGNKDGIHWLRVAFVNQADKQEPDELAIYKSGPETVMVIDTRQPIFRSIEARRQGDEIYVNWVIQEDNPDPKGLRLEYQVKGPGSDRWTPAPVSYSPTGQAQFRVGNGAPLTVRLTMRDLAGNESYAEQEVPGTVATASFKAGGDAGNVGSAPLNPAWNNEPTLPGSMRIENPGIAPVRQSQPVMPPPPLTPNYSVPPPSGDPSTSFSPRLPEEAPRAIGDLPRPQAQFPMNDVSPVGLPSRPNLPPPERREPPPRAIADSRVPLNAIAAPVAPPGPSRAAANEGLPKPPANIESARRPLPDLLYVNNHMVTLEYEVKHVGPSGVGGVELWLTRNDGAAWQRYAIAKDVQGEEFTGRQKRTFEFRDKDERPFPDGIYGLNIVVKNRAGLGREPRPGDMPDIRIEIDKQPPVAVLYQPVPDPDNPDLVLLKWLAKDKNLAAVPIHLDYAEKREGPWVPIKLDLENRGRFPSEEVTGDYSWKVPANIPVQVYLRLRVRDKAGNESVAISGEPQYVDLVIPQGSLINAQPTPK